MLYTKNGTGIFPCWQFKYWKSEDRPDGEGQKTVKIKCLADQIQAIRNIRSSQPIGSTYGLFTCIGIYHKNHPNLCKHIPIPWILWAMVFVETTLCVCGSNQYGFQHPAPFSLVFLRRICWKQSFLLRVGVRMVCFGGVQSYLQTQGVTGSL